MLGCAAWGENKRNMHRFGKKTVNAQGKISRVFCKIEAKCKTYRMQYLRTSFKDDNLFFNSEHFRRIGFLILDRTWQKMYDMLFCSLSSWRESNSDRGD